jgi:hypothetical protein
VTDPARLFAPPPPTGNLTPRQAFVYGQLETATRQGDGLTADEAGALLCERAGRHGAGTRCDFDARNGGAVLKALRKKGLAKNSRARGWVALGTGRAVSPSPDPATDPFPEGY